MSDKKIPCIECTPETWKYIRPHLEEWGYKCSASGGEISKDWNLLIINWNHHLGKYDFGAIGSHLDGTRELLKDVEEFLCKAAELKGLSYCKSSKLPTRDMAEKIPYIKCPPEKLMYVIQHLGDIVLVK